MGTLRDEKIAIRAEKIARLMEAIGRGFTVSEAARSIGVGPATVYRWVSQDTELAKAVLRAKTAADDIVEAVAFRNASDPNPANNVLRMFWLKSRRAEVYRETSKTILAVEEMPDAELESKAKAILAKPDA